MKASEPVISQQKRSLPAEYSKRSSDVCLKNYSSQWDPKRSFLTAISHKKSSQSKQCPPTDNFKRLLSSRIRVESPSSEITAKRFCASPSPVSRGDSHNPYPNLNSPIVTTFGERGWIICSDYVAHLPLVLRGMRERIKLSVVEHKLSYRHLCMGDILLDGVQSIVIQPISSLRDPNVLPSLLRRLLTLREQLRFCWLLIFEAENSTHSSRNDQRILSQVQQSLVRINEAGDTEDFNLKVRKTVLENSLKCLIAFMSRILSFALLKSFLLATFMKS